MVPGGGQEDGQRISLILFLINVNENIIGWGDDPRTLNIKLLYKLQQNMNFIGDNVRLWLNILVCTICAEILPPLTLLSLIHFVLKILLRV